MDGFRFNTVEECLDALRRGGIVLVTDDAGRENECDCICAAEFATPENVNFMATYAKGLICMPMEAARCRELNLPQMVGSNTPKRTPILWILGIITMLNSAFSAIAPIRTT